MTTLPADSNGTPIPALSLKDGGAHSIAIGAASARNATAIPAEDVNKNIHRGRIVSLYATQACFVKIGDATVEATTSDHFFPAGVYYDIALKTGQTHIAVIRESADGTLYISEKD